MLALTFFDLVLAVHVMAVVAAFGVTFAFPVFVPWLRKAHPEAMPALHDARDRIGKVLMGPGLLVVLLAGIYLASKADAWSESWVSVPLVILVIIGGLSGGFFAPNERKLGELARRDLATGATTFSAEYEALFARVSAMGLVQIALVLVAIFFMVAKP